MAKSNSVVQKTVFVETYKASDDVVTFILREPREGNQVVPVMVTQKTEDLSDFFGKLL